MDRTRIARCHCGDLAVLCDGAPRKVSMCHCRDCQRRTGSAFSIAVFYLRGQVRTEGPEPGCFERPSDLGHPVRFFFCRRCGSNLWWEPARMPQLVGVAAGAFADPDFGRPEQSVWTRDKHGWIDLPKEITAFDLAPPPKPAS